MLKTAKTNKLLLVLVFICGVIFLSAFFYRLKFESNGRYDTKNLNVTQLGFPVSSGDPEQYIQLGKNLFSNYSFSDHYNPPYIPNTFRTIGYPVFITIINWIFNSWSSVAIVQILLAAATAVLIFEMGRKIRSAWLGFGAALLFVLDPAVIVYTSSLWPDMLLTFLVALSFYLIFFTESAKVTTFFGYGVLMGLATLVKPVGIYLPLAIIVAILLRTDWSFLIRRNKIIFITLGFAVTVFPWLLRNKVVADSWNISSISAYNLAVYNLLSFASEIGDKPAFQSQIAEIEKKYKDDYVFDPADLVYSPVLTDLKHSRELNAISIPYIKSHFISYAKFHLTRAFGYFFVKSSIIHALDYTPFARHNLEKWNLIPAPDKLVDLFSVWKNSSMKEFIYQVKHNGILFFEKLLRFLMSLLMLIPLWKYRKNPISISLWILVLYFAVLSGPVANARFRLPAEPMMMLLTVWGLILAIDFIKSGYVRKSGALDRENPIAQFQIK